MQRFKLSDRRVTYPNGFSERVEIYVYDEPQPERTNLGIHFNLGEVVRSEQCDAAGNPVTSSAGDMLGQPQPFGIVITRASWMFESAPVNMRRIVAEALPKVAALIADGQEF